MELIERKPAADHNVVVLNETADYYRHFDATRQAEFLYACVEETILHIVPAGVCYLECYEAFRQFVEIEFDMPDPAVALLVRFLEQGRGSLSVRVRNKEFKVLQAEEVRKIERKFKKIFLRD